MWPAHESMLWFEPNTIENTQDCKHREQSSQTDRVFVSQYFNSRGSLEVSGLQDEVVVRNAPDLPSHRENKYQVVREIGRTYNGCLAAKAGFTN